jgi:sec-independent protein translocase protein TatA
MSLGITELLLILLVVVLVFGAGKLPKAMRDIGVGIKSFRDGMHSDDKNPPKDNA